MVTGTRTNETVVNRHDAANMKYKTTTAWVKDRRKTFKFKHTWSETVVVSAESLLVMSPAGPAKYQDAVPLTREA